MTVSGVEAEVIAALELVEAGEVKASLDILLVWRLRGVKRLSWAIWKAADLGFVSIVNTGVKKWSPVTLTDAGRLVLAHHRHTTQLPTGQQGDGNG